MINHNPKRIQLQRESAHRQTIAGMRLHSDGSLTFLLSVQICSYGGWSGHVHFTQRLHTRDTNATPPHTDTHTHKHTHTQTHTHTHTHTHQGPIREVDQLFLKMGPEDLI